MRYKLAEYGFSDPGDIVDRRGCPLMEDAAFPAVGVSDAAASRLFVVCDGMGGAGAGDVAADTVCLALSEALPDDGNFSVSDFAKAIDSAYDRLDSASMVRNGKTGTTLAALKFFSKGAAVAHIGDSRVYHLRPGSSAESTQILFCTTDHNFANFMVKKGELSHAQAFAHEKARVLTRAMLPNMQHRCSPDISVITDIRPGDYFLVCTDGILENLSDLHLRSIFSHDGGNIVNKRALLAKASANSSDNRTALIVNVREVIMEPGDKPSKISNGVKPSRSSKPYDTISDKHSRNMKNFSPSSSSLSVKLLIALFVLLALFMVIYSLFIRHDEVLQQAGTAVDKPLNLDQEETYGYEITAQDISNQANPIAPEVADEVSDESVDVVAEDAEDIPDDAPDNSQDAQSPAEPVLQE